MPPRFHLPKPSLNPEADPCRDESCPIEELHAQHARVTPEERRLEKQISKNKAQAQKRRWEREHKTPFPAGGKPPLTPKLVLHERIAARKYRGSVVKKVRGLHFKIPPPEGLKAMLAAFSMRDVAKHYDVDVQLVRRWVLVVEDPKFVQPRRSSKKEQVFRALREYPQTTAEVHVQVGGSIRQVLRYLKSLAREGAARRIEEGWVKK